MIRSKKEQSSTSSPKLNNWPNKKLVKQQKKSRNERLKTKESENYQTNWLENVSFTF